MCKNIDTLDLYSIQPSFYINNSRTFSTFFTKVLSIFSYIAIFAFAIYFSWDLFTKDNITVIQVTSTPKKPIPFDLYKNKFVWTVALEDPITYDPFVDEGIYTVKGFHKTGTRDSAGKFSWKEVEISVSKCTTDMFDSKYQETYLSKPLSKMYCVNNINHTLEGTYLNDEYSFLFINVELCDNSTRTEGNYCKTKEEIEYYINGTFIGVTFPDIYIDSRNYHNPDQPIWADVYTTVSKFIKREMHIYLKDVEVLSDVGIMLTSFKTLKFSKFDYLQDMFWYNYNNDLAFCSITWKLNNKKENIQRSYIKIQTVVANWGGVLKVVVTWGYLLTYLYMYTSYELCLLNSFCTDVTDNKCSKGVNNDMNRRSSGKWGLVKAKKFGTNLHVLMNANNNNNIKANSNFYTNNNIFSNTNTNGNNDKSQAQSIKVSDNTSKTKVSSVSHFRTSYNKGNETNSMISSLKLVNLQKTNMNSTQGEVQVPKCLIELNRAHFKRRGASFRLKHYLKWYVNSLFPFIFSQDKTIQIFNNSKELIFQYFNIIEVINCVYRHKKANEISFGLNQKTPDEALRNQTRISYLRYIRIVTMVVFLIGIVTRFWCLKVIEWIEIKNRSKKKMDNFECLSK